MRRHPAPWRQAELLALGGLLGYPDRRWHDRFPARYRVIVRDRLDRRAALVPLSRLTPDERRRLYVATFDFDGGAALYLTAHVAGDDRRRGARLGELQDLLGSAGFLPPNGELPDYIPALLEFLAVVPGQQPTLGRRVGQALGRIATHLRSDHPYRPLFVWGAEWLRAGPEKDPVHPRQDEEGQAPVPYPADPLAFDA